MSSKINTKKYIPKNIIQLLKAKDKERILNIASEKQHITYESSIRSSANLSVENSETRRQWNNIFKMLKELSTENPFFFVFNWTLFSHHHFIEV